MSNVIPRPPGMTFEQRDRAIGMLTAGMLARDVALHFKCHKSTIGRLLTRFQQTGNFIDRSRSGRPCKPRRTKTIFSRLHLDTIDFFPVESWPKSLRQDSHKSATCRKIESMPSLLAFR